MRISGTHGASMSDRWPASRRSTSCAPAAPSTALAHLATDRRRLRHVDGPRRSGACSAPAGARDTGPSADLRRTALFAVWRDEADLDAFLARSPVAGRWSRRRGVVARPPAGDRRPRVVARRRRARRPGARRRRRTDRRASTRADVRVRAWRAFRAAGPAGQRRAARAPGLLAVAGIGELPVGRLGTFSLWTRCSRRSTAFAAQPATAPSCAAPAPSAGTARSCSPASSPTPAQAPGTVATRSPPDALARTCRGTIGTSIP